MQSTSPPWTLCTNFILATAALTWFRSTVT
jgi:hypothetical protein